MKLKILLLIIISGFFLSGCTSSSNYSGYYDDYDSYDDYNSYESDYEDPITSDNWDCTGDCSGHEAGYQWALDNDISEAADCGGNSDSFVEGCEAYVNEYQQEEYEDNYYY